MLTIWNAKSDFIKLRQQKGQSVQEYFEWFIALKEVNDTLETNVHACTGLVDALAHEKGQDPTQLSDTERADLISQGSERMMAIHFLLGADRERFGSAIQDFEHSYLMDHKNRYPKSLHDTYNLLKGWKKGQMSQVNKVGVSFNTNGEDEDGTALVNKGYTGPACSRCSRKNHPIEKCIAKRHEDGTILHVEGGHGGFDDGELDQVSGNSMYVSSPGDVHELMFLQSNDRAGSRRSSSNRTPIPATWILIDSQSTIDVFSNAELLTGIERYNTTMHIRCNAGVKSTNLRGYMAGYGWVWYFPLGIANILSLSHVKDKYRVTFDSATDNCFHVHKPGGILKFSEASRRLYYFDTEFRNERQFS